MSYEVTYEGSIFIDPPLTYADLKREIPTKPIFRTSRTIPTIALKDAESTGSYALRLVIEETIEEVETGIFIEKICREIEYSYYSSPTADAQWFLNQIVELFPDRTYSGHIQCTGEDGKVWRLKIEDGEVRRIQPLITWPD